MHANFVAFDVNEFGRECCFITCHICLLAKHMELSGTCARQVWNVNLSYILESFRLLQGKDQICILDLSDNQMQSLNSLGYHLNNNNNK